MKNLFFIVSLYFSLMVITAADASIWINEFHYDNSGNDIDEGIEIAAAAGTDLNQFHLLLYNGNNGEIYRTIVLSGVIADQQEGFGAIYFAISGIQNGPDGIALVDSTDTVLQFISYELSFVAVEGAAVGMQSVDIQLFEDNTTEVGTSLQLQGSGQMADDFTWVQDATSFGQINAQQNFGAPVPLPASLPLLATAFAYMFILRKRPGTFVPSRL